MTRQYFQTYYYVEDTDHPEFNGWINKNAVEGPEKVITNTVNVPGPKRNGYSNGYSTWSNKTVTVPAENKLTINYLTYRFDPSGKYTKADWKRCRLDRGNFNSFSGIQKIINDNLLKQLTKLKIKRN